MNEMILKEKYKTLENDFIILQKENKKLKDLCDKYEEEHKTTFEEWKKDIKANKKAIEYIEKYLQEHIIDEYPDEQSTFYDEKDRFIPNAKEQLLNILKGE